MDLGTANTIIIKDDKIVLDEPSVVAFDNRTGEMIAVGTKAREMYEKGNANIRTIRPLRDGVIVKRASTLSSGDAVTIRFADGEREGRIV